LGLNIPFLAVQTLGQSKSNYSMISTCGNEFDFHNGLPETDIPEKVYLNPKDDDLALEPYLFLLPSEFRKEEQIRDVDRAINLISLDIGLTLPTKGQSTELNIAIGLQNGSGDVYHGNDVLRKLGLKGIDDLTDDDILKCATELDKKARIGQCSNIERDRSVKLLEVLNAKPQVFVMFLSCLGQT
jgi:hypothetical protein